MNTIEILQQKRDQIKAENPKLRNRNLAERLDISELELLNLDLGEHITRLEGDWKQLLIDLKAIGYVMALTRNEHAVHERKGVYENIEFYGGHMNVGVAVNPDIDLRFFMNEWKYALAVVMPREKGQTLYSFQFFSERGEAVHKVFSTPQSAIDPYYEIVSRYKAEDQRPALLGILPPVEVKTETPDDEIDVEGFREAWRSLKDTHHFFGMLRKYGVSRTQALRLAPEGMTTQVDNKAVERMLTLSAERGVSIMCFLHSKGCVQIHTGPVKNLKWFGDWYNVLDPKFNLHLNMDSVASSWVVKKPTDDGIVTSLELFDKDGTMITYFFGARKPGIPELVEWRDIISETMLVSV
jgi:putative hemin transport protein